MLGKSSSTIFINDYNNNYMKKSTLPTNSGLLKTSNFLKAVTMFVLSVFFSSSLFAATYYWNGNTFNTASSWTTLRAGGGTAASNFTTAGDIFIVQGTGATTNGVGTGASNQSLTANASWTIATTSNAVTLEVEGGATLTMSTAITMATKAKFVLDNGATYNHNVASDLGADIFVNAGTAGAVTLGASSTVVVQNMTTSSFSHTLPTFGNLTFNMSSYTTLAALSAKLTNVAGNLTLQSFGSGGGLKLGGSLSVTGSITVSSGVLCINSGTSTGAGSAITVTGDVDLKGGDFSPTASSSTACTLTCNNFIVEGGTYLNTTTVTGAMTTTINGNLTITSGTFNFSNPTGNANGNVYTVNLVGNLAISGTGSMATPQSGKTPSTSSAFNFNGSSSTFSFGGTGTFTNSTSVTAIPFVVLAGKTLTLNSGFTIQKNTVAASLTVNGTLDCGAYTVNGAGNFTLASGTGATLKTALGGVNEAITTTGTNTLNSGNNFEFDGSVASKSTGALMPTSVNNLYINNSSGITLSQATTVTGVLTLNSGNLTTTTTNLLSVTNTAIGAVTGSSSSYVSGPLKWTLPTNASATKYSFPVGTSSAYLPFDLTYTASAATSTAQVQAFSGSFSPANDGTIAPSSTEYWSLTTTGTVLTSLKASLGKSSLGSNTLIGTNATGPSGSYSSIAGSTGVTVGGINGIGVSNAITGTPGTAGAFYLAMGAVPCSVPSQTITPASASICANTTGNTASVPVSAGGSYNWTISGTGASITSGQASATVTFSVGTASPTLSCVVTSSTGCASAGGQNTSVTVYSVFTSGAISTTGQTICSGGTPTVIGSSTAASGGDGSITYSWRSSADGYTAAISGATSATYTPPSGLSSTTGYRRYANDGTCNTSATVSTGTWTVTVTVNLSSVGVTPSGTQNIYTNTSGSQLTAAETGGGTITGRQWGYRTTSGGSITNISGSTSSTYTPAGTDFAGANTYYVVCTSTPTCGAATVSNEVTVVVSNPITPTLVAGSISGFGSVTVGQTPSNTFTLTGSNLDGSDVTITPPSGFSASPSTISGYGTSFSQTITVTFSPTAVQSYNATLTCSGGSATSQNVSLTGSGIALTAPTSLSITHTSDNIQRLSWTAPSGAYDKVLVFASTSSSAYTPSGTGASYTGANANIGSATTYGASYSLVYAGTGTNVEVTGLSNSTTYYYQVISYSGSFYSSAITANGATLLSPVTGLSATVANASSVVSWTNPSYNGTQSNYWDEVMVIASTSAVSTPTGNGSSYTASATYGSGTAYGSGYVVYKGTGATVTVSSLTNLTAYTYSVYVRHGSVWSSATTAIATPVPYATGDLVSVASAAYGTATTWNTWNGTALTTGSVPSATTNVWIVGGYTITAAAGSCKDLHVLNGILKSGTVCHTSVAISISGTTVEVNTNGTVGNGLADDAADGISFTFLNAGTTTITGTGGTIDVSKFILGTASQTVVIDHDITAHYHGSGDAGNAFGVYPNGVNNTTLTINSGKTLTMAKWSCLGGSSSSHSAPAFNFTLNVNGTLTFLKGKPNTSTNGFAIGSNSGYLSLNAGSGNLFTLAVGSTGTINVNELFPNGTLASGAANRSTSTSSITIASGGVINVDSIADFRNASQTVTGAGTFRINSTAGAIMKISSASGITSSGASGPIQTTTRVFDGTYTTYSYEGNVAQVTGSGLPSSVYGLRIMDSVSSAIGSLTLSNATTVSGSLKLLYGVLTTTSTNLLTLGANAVDSGGAATCYINGPMQNTLASTTSTPLVFPIGKVVSTTNYYNPVTLTVTQNTASSTTYKAEAFDGGTTPTHTLPSTLSAISSYKYYTLSSSASNISTASIGLNYDANDANGGAITTATAANLRIAGSSGWDDLGGTGTVSTAGTITSTNSFTALGDFVIANALVLGTPPTLTAAAGATVDANFNITFTDDATWRGVITSVKYGSNTLTAGTDYSISAGVLTLKPGGSSGSGLRTPGTQTVTISATNYNDATVSQTIAVGAAAKLAMKTQPVAPVTTGAAFATQPAVYIQDQYGNTITSTASVTVAVGAGSWTLGGTVTVAAVSGTATFSGLTGSASSNATGSTMTFTASGLTSVTSNTFTVPGPVTYYWVGGASATFGAVGTLATSVGGTGNASAYTGMNTAGNTDVFIFDGTNIGGGATGTVTFSWPSSATTYYGQIKLQNGATVVGNATGTRTITIDGGSGTDFSIPSGCNFSTTGSTTSFSLLTGTTGSISGTVTFGPGTSTTTITAADAGALVFNNGANCTFNGSSSSTSPFGTGTAGSVIFANGSTLTDTKAGDVFGGNKVVTFQTGSTYIYNNPSTSQLIFDGNTYANLTIGASATIPAGGTGVSINGDLNVTGSSTVVTVKEIGTANTISGNINVASGSSLVFSPASASTFTLNGSSLQTITNSGTLTIPSLQTIQISNTHGISLGSNVTSAGSVTLSSGVITLGNYNFTAATVTGGSASSYIDASGTGKFILTSVPVTSTVFPIGTATYYAPLTLVGGTSGRTITTGVKGALTNAPASPNNIVNLEWSILASAATSPTITFQYNAANQGSGYSSSSPVLGTYVSSYTETSLGSVSGTNPYTVSTGAAIALPTGTASLYAIGNNHAFLLTVPGAPTSVTAVDGNTQATISFTAPVDNGGATITGYTVTSSPGNKTGTGSTSPIIVTGLTNGTAYTFTVKASNSVGSSVASTASNSVTPTSTTTWDGATWSLGAPTTTSTAVISANLTNTQWGGATSVSQLTVNSGVTFANTGTISITGASFINNGSISGGTVVLAGTSSQTISGTGIVSNLTLNNSAGATISSGSNNLGVSGILTLQSGQLTTNGNLTFKSTSITNTGTLAPYGASGNTGTINGTVTVERYIPAGYRAYRDMEHNYLELELFILTGKKVEALQVVRVSLLLVLVLQMQILQTMQVVNQYQTVMD